MALLRLKALKSPSPRVWWNIESPVAGVVLIEVVLESNPAPLHWRAGLWEKPPLDLSMDSSGRMIGFQFVLQDERVPLAEDAGGPRVTAPAWPVFDVDSWPEDRYMDEHIPVTVGRLAAGTLLLGIGNLEGPDRLLEVGDGLAVGLTDGMLREIRLGPLDADDWESIDAFSPVA